MREYIIKRLLFIIPLFFIVSFGAFGIANLSTDQPAVIVLMAQGVPEITEEMIEITNEEYGFNKPFLTRYADWLKDALRLDFGKSYVSEKDVGQTVMTAFGYTLQLALATALTTVLFSLLLGIICALWEDRLADRGIRFLMFILSAMPAYWIGLLLMWLLCVKFHLLPTSGVGSFKNFILPTMVTSISFCGFYFRMIRNNMLENINENYVLFFRASGVKNRRIVLHILRNSLQTVITAFSMAIPGMISGTAVVENIFAWPGLGRLCVTAVFSRDIPIIQAYVLLIALFYCLFNILSDIINAWINPRLREA